MVGNDVVDLGDPETRAGACHPRFDERVFTDSERDHLDRAADSRLLRWWMWAAKESAFKLAKQRDARATFSPRTFEVTQIGTDRAVLAHGGDQYQISVRTTGDALHAVCTAGPPDPDRLLTGIAPTPPRVSPSTAVRDLAKRLLAHRLGVLIAQLEIRSDGHRIPRLVMDDHEAQVHLSLSHHGRYVACACCIQAR